MIKNGIFLIVAGFFMAFVYPSLQTKLSGQELATAPIYERGNGGFLLTPVVSLKEADNPIKLRISGYFLPGTPYLGNSVSFKVKIAGQHGTLLDETVKMFIKSDSQSSLNEDGLQKYDAHASLFLVNVSGDYNIDVGMEYKVDFSLSKVVVTVLSNATVPDTRFRTPGIIAMVFGVFLFVRRRKNKRNRKPSKTETTSPQIDEKGAVEKPAKEKIRWGRHADLD